MSHRMLGVLLLLVAVVAGCDAASHIVVEPDGSGTYSMVLSIEDGDGGAASGDDLYQQVKKALSDNDTPIDVSRYHEDGKTGAEITFAFRSLPDLQAAAARAEQLGGGIGDIDLQRSDTGWHFTSTATGLDGIDRDPGMRVESGIDASQILGGLYHLSLVVDLPGRPATSNATSISRKGEVTRFTWKLEAGKAPGPLEATTTFVGDQAGVDLSKDLTPTAAGRTGKGGDGSSDGPLIAGAVVLGLTALGGGMALRRRRRPADAGPSAG